MKSLKQINKMLEGYIVGRPASRNRKYKEYAIFLESDFGCMTVYAYKEGEIYFKKVIFNNWLEAFIYYYNTIETKLKG